MLVSELKALLPYHLQQRYGNTQIYAWINQGLRALQLEGITLSVKKEFGLEVENDVWITPPSSVIRPIEIYSPRNADVIYPFEEIEGKAKLIERTFDKEDDPTAITTFSNYDTEYIDVDLTDYDEDDLGNYLLVIDGGTISGNTYIIAGNDESGETTTRIYFMHELSAVMDGTQVTSGYLVDDFSYLMLKGITSYTEVSATTDEIATDDEIEDCLISFLTWKAHERVQTTSDDTKYWKGQFDEQLKKINGFRLRVGRKQMPIGRPLPGLKQSLTERYSTTHESED